MDSNVPINPPINPPEDWTTDIEKVLENFRINCVILSKEHKRRYLYLKHLLLYFRLPVIIISGINSVISVGFQNFIQQEYISLTTCLLALICGIIGSVELYLAIQKMMENELMSSQQYYLLGIDIYKNLTLSKEHRQIPAKEYLEKCYSEYIKLFENSFVIAKKLEDQLAPLPNINNSVGNLETPTKNESSLDFNDVI